MTSARRYLAAALLLGLSTAGFAQSTAESVLDLARANATNDEEFLDPSVAFRLSAEAVGPDRVRLTWQIADGYYIYRSRLKADTSSPAAQLGQMDLPAGKMKTDEYFGEQEVYYHEIVAALPVARAASASATELPLSITHQGCADAGLCYPPETREITVTLPPGSASSVGFVSEQDWFAQLLRDGSLLAVIGFFFVAGLGLSLTPCMWPMVPILSGIIAGQGANATAWRSFALSLSYVLGLAVTYAVAGALFAAAGQQAQAVFQQPWIIVLFAGLFVALALSMFGFFNLQMPAAIQTRLTDLSNRQSAGTYGGVAAMGALSALIVTACVAPPLIGALTVIAQTGDIARGALALFVMSLGMGAPLLIVGASAGKLLPKAGAWMDVVKQFFGVLMLGVAVWMLARIVPERIALVLWAVPTLIAGWLLWKVVRRAGAALWITRAVAVAVGLYGVALLAGAAMGATDPLAPLPRFAQQHDELPFTTIKSVEDLTREVAAAKAKGQPVLLDFYADWCVSCKEMEKYTFTDADVRAALAGVLLLRADVTANDALDQALLKHFRIFGPPTIAFYDADGIERSNFRVVGFKKPVDFAPIARQALGREALAAASP